MRTFVVCSLDLELSISYCSLGSPRKNLISGILAKVLHIDHDPLVL